MIKADRVLGTPRADSSSLSRRQAIAGLASLSAALPAATFAAEPDPIYAAIQTCRDAKQGSDAAFDRISKLNKLAKIKVGGDLDSRNAFIEGLIGMHPDDYTGEAGETLCDSYEVFASTVPTTPAGLFAMLGFAHEITEQVGDVLNDGPIFSTLATAAKRLARA